MSLTEVLLAQVDEIEACHDAAIADGINYDCENIGSGSSTGILGAIWDVVGTPSDGVEWIMAGFFWWFIGLTIIVGIPQMVGKPDFFFRFFRK